ncbi:MAG: methyltransferase domain-containing protein [Chlorobium sp.]|nr:MAG: methyltransferase domain-containing protein [Chlorobium sp.]
MKIKLLLKKIIEITAAVIAIFSIIMFLIQTTSLVAIFCFIVVFLLILLMFFNPVSRLRNIFRRLKILVSDQPLVTWYLYRDQVKPIMLGTWKNYKYLIFVGITQESLKQYFEEVLANNQKYQWTHIDVYFACDQLGSIYRENSFLPTVKKARQEIATMLLSSSSKIQLPDLQKISFFQCKNPVGFTGSFYCKDLASDPDKIYIVQSLAYSQYETKNALTFSIAADGSDALSSAHSIALYHYRYALKMISDSRVDLGKFEPSSRWNESVEAWQYFCQNSKLPKAEMSGLIEINRDICSFKGKHVLDLGCGSGETSILLLNEDLATLTVVDKSPQMLMRAKSYIGEDARVTFALCSIPSFSLEDIDIKGKFFDVIVVHQGIPAIASTLDEVLTLANWARERLNNEGRLLFAIHDNALSTANTNWNDPFRMELLSIANNHSPQILRGSKPSLFLEDIERNVIQAGFEMTQKKERDFHLTMEDRRLMWKTPAVLDSFFDLTKISVQEADDLAQLAFRRVGPTQTRPRKVTYISFCVSVN